MGRVVIAWGLLFALWAEEKPGRVSGRVEREDTGGGLAKALVALYPQDQETSGGRRLTESGADGSFVFVDVAPGSYALTASRNGFSGGEALHIALKPAAEIADLRLKLTAAGVISGTVVDRDGEPVQGLAVRVQRVQYLPGARRQVSEGMRALSDDQGRFRLYGLNRGLYYLRTGGRIETPMQSLPLKQSPEHGIQYGDTWYPDNALTDYGQPLRVEAGLDIGEVKMVVKREPVYTISGHIEGKPAPTDLQCARRLGVTLMYGSTDIIKADGTFEIEGLEAGDYVLSAMSNQDGRTLVQGYAAVRVIDRNVRTTIPLGAAGEVRGKVKAAGFDPLGLEVYLDSGEMAIYPAKVDANGEFVIRNVPPGDYRFALRDRRYYIQGALSPVTVSVGSVLADCLLTLSHDTGEVRGRVMQGDAPLADFEVVAVPQDVELRRIPRYTSPGKTDADGRFVLHDVIPGDYWLFARRQDRTGEVFALHFAEQHPGEDVRVEVKNGEVAEVDVKK